MILRVTNMKTRRLVLAGPLVLCCTAAMAQDGGNIWGSREPTACPALAPSQPPGEAEAQQLVKCRRETAVSSTGDLWLMENVQVGMGPPRPFWEFYNSYVMPEADVNHDVLPIQGSWTWFRCIAMADAAKSGDANRNCTETDVTGASGVCWVTSGGTWQCNLVGGSSGEPRGPSQPPT